MSLHRSAPSSESVAAVAPGAVGDPPAAAEASAAPARRRSRLKDKLPYAISASALFWSLTGTATAAGVISGALILDETITSLQIKDGSVQARDLAPGLLPESAQATAPAGLLTLNGITGGAAGGAITVESLWWRAWVEVGSGGIGRRDVGDLVVQKKPDAATTPLWQAATSGTPISGGQLGLRASGAASAQAYATIELGRVYVSAVETSTSGGKDLETVRLTFDRRDAGPLFSYSPTLPAPVGGAGTLRLGGVTSQLSAVGGSVTKPLQLGSTGVVGAGRTQIAPFSLRKSIDNVTPALRRSVDKGEPIQDVTIATPASGGQPARTVKLSTAVVSGWGLKSALTTTEEVQLTPLGRVQVETQLPGRGTLVTCFDVAQNASC